VTVLTLRRVREQFRGQQPFPGDVVFRHACKIGLEGIVSKRLGSCYVSGRTHERLKMKNPEAPAVKREAEEDWGR
jgi:ATP-dependent DNA ligase